MRLKSKFELRLGGVFPDEVAVRVLEEASLEIRGLARQGKEATVARDREDAGIVLMVVLVC